MKHVHTFESFLNEANNKAVTKQDWNRADDEQREKWLSSAIEDPNDIEDLVDAEWEDLPDVAISNMMKESLNEGTDYAVMLTGGSIGDKPRPRDARGYVGMEVDKAEELTNLQNAKAKAKRMNGNLSPGEKSHYGLKYIVVPVSNGKFIKESLNEATLNNFIPDTISRAESLDTKLFKSLMPKTEKTSEEAMERIWDFDGNTMFAHYQYFVVMPNGNKPNRPTYRIHQSQYWLNDAQMRMQRRDPKEKVNVTLITLYDITDGKDERIGRAYVYTDVFLDEYKRVFEVLNTQS